MPVADSENAYLQVKLDSTISIMSFGQRGRAGSDQYVTEVKLLYSLDGENWSTYMEPYGTEYVIV